MCPTGLDQCEWFRATMTLTLTNAFSVGLNAHDRRAKRPNSGDPEDEENRGTAAERGQKSISDDVQDACVHYDFARGPRVRRLSDTPYPVCLRWRFVGLYKTVTDRPCECGVYHGAIVSEKSLCTRRLRRASDWCAAIIRNGVCHLHYRFVRTEKQFQPKTSIDFVNATLPSALG